MRTSARRNTAASAICALLTIAGSAACTTPAPDVRESIIAAGYLTGMLHGQERPGASRAERATEQIPSLLRLAWTSLEQSQSPAAAADLAIVELAAGQFDAAIVRLRAAADEDPRYLTDLSAGYIERHAAAGDALDLLRAATTARTANESLATTASAFNLATALTKLNLRRTAARAWEELDGVPEAADHIRSLRAATPRSIWEEAKPGLIDLPRHQLEEAVQRFPVQSRTYALEEVLPRWATLLQGGSTAEARRFLDFASVLGEIHADELDEAMLSSSVARLSHLDPASDADARALEALSKLQAAIAAYEAQDVDWAEDELNRIASALSDAGIPLGLWAEFYAAISTYYRDTNAGYRLFLGLEGRLEGSNFGGLQARIQWMLGTCDVVHGRLASSVNRYERAGELLLRYSGAGAAAFVDVLLAEAFSRIGDFRSSWKHRKRAFAAVPDWESPRRIMVTYSEAGTALVLDSQAELALPLLDESVAVAREWSQPLGLAMAHERRALAHLRSGRRAGATSDIDSSRDALDEMAPGGWRDMLAYFVDLTEGELTVDQAPHRALDLLTGAFELHEARGYSVERIEYLTNRARALLALGEKERATREFELAAETYESKRNAVADPRQRALAFRQSQAAFDSLVELSLPDSPERAFAFSERGRARLLLDGWVDEELSPPSLPEIARALPPNAALVHYALLPQSLVAWIVEPDGYRTVIRAVDARELTGSIRLFRSAVESRAPLQRVHELGAGLFDTLIRPLDTSATTIVLVPGPGLAETPFSALYDSDSHLYLAESATVAISPSSTLFLHTSARLAEAQAQTDQPSGLVVAVSESFPTELGLPPLYTAVDEAHSVAGIYGAAALLEESATREQVLGRLGEDTIFHFAGHTLLHSMYPLESGLVVAEDSTGALISARDLLSASWTRTRLVVLSACSSLGFPSRELPDVFGLAGMLMASGVPATVSNRWPLEDRFATTFMSSFHTEYKQTASAPQALARTIRTVLSNPTHPYQHPHYWGGLAVLGGITQDSRNDDL